MHGNQWVLKIAVLKYYSVSKRGTTAKSNPKQATDPISLHTKFGDNSSNTFPLNERKPCVTPDIGRRTPDAGHRTSDGEKSKNNISTPQGGGHNESFYWQLQSRVPRFHITEGGPDLIVYSIHHKILLCSKTDKPSHNSFHSGQAMFLQLSVTFEIRETISRNYRYNPVTNCSSTHSVVVIIQVWVISLKLHQLDLNNPIFLLLAHQPSIFITWITCLKVFIHVTCNIRIISSVMLISQIPYVQQTVPGTNTES